VQDAWIRLRFVENALNGAGWEKTVLLFQNRRNSSLLCVLFAGLIMASWPSRSLAQTTATITGTVGDSSGAVVPGAAVTLIQEDTKDKHVLKTQGDGTFVIPDVFPGRYTIQVEAT
jgi:hypothetical protein